MISIRPGKRCSTAKLTPRESAVSASCIKKSLRVVSEVLSEFQVLKIARISSIYSLSSSRTRISFSMISPLKKF